jgi:hypothetical protein
MSRTNEAARGCILGIPDAQGLALPPQKGKAASPGSRGPLDGPVLNRVP